MLEYRVIVTDPNGVRLGEFETWTNLTATKKLNDYGTTSITLPLNHPKLAELAALRRNCIYVYENEVPVWAGEMAIKKGNLDNVGGGLVELTCYTWFEQLRNKITPAEVIYDGIDAGQIAWEMIDTAQTGTNASLGITEGTITATQDRDRTYYNDNVYEEIIRLSEVIGGFDFDISINKVFNVYTYKSLDLSESIILEYGNEIATVTITDDFTSPINRAIVIGEVSDSDEIQRVERNNTVSQALYRIREQKSPQINVTELTTLQDRGDSLLAKYEVPLTSLDITLRPGIIKMADIDTGDLVRVKVQKGIYNIDDIYRIYEIELQRTADDYNIIKLLLAKFSL